MDYQTEKVRYISHEVKNQLSVCDLYTEILLRYCQKNGIEDESILKSVGCIKRAVQMAGNSLLELKSSDNQVLEELSVKEVLEEACDLSEVYGSAKKVSVKTDIEISEDEKVLIDKNRFQACIINLIKNACEAFQEEEDKHIIVSAQKENSIIKVVVSNNASPVADVDIFNEGVTTKETGSGLGLYISRRNMEEMGGTLRLIKSDTTSTDFEIMLKTI